MSEWTRRRNTYHDWLKEQAEQREDLQNAQQKISVRQAINRPARAIKQALEARQGPQHIRLHEYIGRAKGEADWRCIALGSVALDQHQGSMDPHFAHITFELMRTGQREGEKPLGTLFVECAETGVRVSTYDGSREYRPQEHYWFNFVEDYDVPPERAALLGAAAATLLHALADKLA